MPFAGSSYWQESVFYLAEDATLIVGDAYSGGHVAHGECFAFDRLYSRTRILRENVPQAVDGLDLPGGGEPFGGYSYLGALYVLAPESSRRWPKSYTPP
ncbi:MAG: urease accessory protein UreD [Actinomycetota bacterium]|nr:urease accessory protein UreD [Actinomycetota bacterium]